MGQAEVAAPIIVDHGGRVFVIGTWTDHPLMEAVPEGRPRDGMFCLVASDLVAPCFEKLPDSIAPQERLLLVFRALCKAYRNGRRDESLENALGSTFVRANLVQFTQMMAKGTETLKGVT